MHDFIIVHGPSRSKALTFGNYLTDIMVLFLAMGMLNSCLTKCLQIIENQDPDLNGLPDTDRRGDFILFIIIFTPAALDLRVVSRVDGQIGVVEQLLGREADRLVVNHGEDVVSEG